MTKQKIPLSIVFYKGLINKTKQTKNMKLKAVSIPIMVIVLLATSVSAYVFNQFDSWHEVLKRSPDIIVATCWDPTSPTLHAIGPKSDYQIEILSVLKGTNTVTSSRLFTDHELERGRAYLIFGQYVGNGFDAGDAYRVIELNKDFQLNALTGKTLNEKLQLLFQSGVENIKTKIQEDEAEKGRLEQALKQ